MVALIDITGQRFGILTVISRTTPDSTKKTRWICSCDCGGTTVTTGLNLKSGNTKSCGCLNHRKGADNPRTVTDPARIRERKRSYAAHKEWRRNVFGSNPRCMKCGSKKNLHAHHIEGYADFPAKREDPDNGISLCKACHMEFHVKYGRRTGFTREDICEYVAGIREDPGVVDEIVNLNWREFAAIRYITRWRHKNGIEDLKKARHYIDLLIELESQ